MNKAIGVVALIFLLGIGYYVYQNFAAPSYSMPDEAAGNSPANAVEPESQTNETPPSDVPPSDTSPPSEPSPGQSETPTVTAGSMYFSSSTYSADVGQTFTVAIMATAENLVGWEFHVLYDQNILHAVAVEEGDLLARSGMATFYIDSGGYNDVCGIHNEAGYVWLVDAILGKCQGVSGSGVLATITFQVMHPGSCSLSFQDAKLCAPGWPTAQLMPISVTNASFHT